jgi:hypothetical protein
MLKVYLKLVQQCVPGNPCPSPVLQVIESDKGKKEEEEVKRARRSAKMAFDKTTG